MKDDLVVVDIWFAPDAGLCGQPKYCPISRFVFIPCYYLFTPKNLIKLPKNKKIILVDHMLVHEN